jgi:hypothetical protein
MIPESIAGRYSFPSPNNRVRKISRPSRSGGTGSAPVQPFLTGADHHQPTGKAQKPSLPRGIALGTRQYGRLGFNYYCGLLPSVAQPPFPLHEFLPGCLPPP